MTATAETTPSASEKPKSIPVIVLDSWGNYYVYPATIEGAKKLLEDALKDLSYPLPSMTLLAAQKALKESPDDLSIPYKVPDSTILRAFKDLTSEELGTPSSALYRMMTAAPVKGETTPTVKEIRDEYVLWAFENKFDAAVASPSKLNEVHPEKTLSFFSGLLARAKGHPVEFVYASDFEEADELNTLLYGAWKPTARVGIVVSRYLSILNRLSHRDQKYHLGTMEPPL